MTSRRLQLTLTILAVVSCSVLAGPAVGTSATYRVGASALSTASSPSCAGANADPVEIDRDAIARSTVCLLNEERTGRGLGDLRLNPRLSEAARSHSSDMVAKRYFDHVSKGGKDVVDRLTRTGYLGDARSWIVGENLAWGSGGRSTPREIVKAWMNSSGHRQNILTGRFREIGIGVVIGTPANGAPQGATYTTTFGARG